MTPPFSPSFEWARWMGRNGRMAVEAAFTWNRIADQTLNVYYHWHATNIGLGDELISEAVSQGRLASEE